MDKNINPSKENKIIKIKLLDIFPSMNELKQQKNEIDIIFQGLDIFYNLSELLTTKKEISLNTPKSSIIISLIKSSNIIATCLFAIKPGEQWINFSYENKKKKDSTLAQNLIDCIKIKINCQICKETDGGIKNNNNNNNSIATNSKKLKRNFPNNSKTNYGSVLTENSNIKSQSLINPNFHKLNLNSRLLTNKGNKRISLESSPKEKTVTKTKFTYLRNNHTINNNSTINNQNHVESINKKKDFNNDKKTTHEEKGLKRMNTKNSYSRMIDDDLATRLNKMFHKTEENRLNLTQRTRKNLHSNCNLEYIDKGNENNFVYNNLKINKNHKNKQLLKNKLLYNSKKTEIKNITNEYNNNRKIKTEVSTNTLNNNLNNIYNNYENNNSKKRKCNNNRVERSHDYIENFNVGEKIGPMTNRRNKDVIKDLKNNTSTIAKTPDISRSNKYNMKNNYDKTIDSEKYTINDEKINKNKDIKDSPILKNLSSDLDSYSEYKKNFDEISNNSIYESDNYSKLKEDFILLYSDNYVQNVQEDLLKLEIELFVEKMTGLISAYHYEINEKKLENTFLEKNLKENSVKYIDFSKLYAKLNLIKKSYKKKYQRILKNKTNIKDINNKNFETNKNELELFKLIFPNKNDDKNKKNFNNINKSEELKNIINILLKKEENKKIFINTDLYTKWCDINKIECEINVNKDINRDLDKEKEEDKEEDKEKDLIKDIDNKNKDNVKDLDKDKDKNEDIIVNKDLGKDNNKTEEKMENKEINSDKDNNKELDKDNNKDLNKDKDNDLNKENNIDLKKDKENNLDNDLNKDKDKDLNKELNKELNKDNSKELNKENDKNLNNENNMDLKKDQDNDLNKDKNLNIEINKDINLNKDLNKDNDKDLNKEINIDLNKDKVNDLNKDKDKDLNKEFIKELNKELNKDKDINKELDKSQDDTKYVKKKARARVIPKLQQTKFISKNNNINIELNNNIISTNDNKSEKFIINSDKKEEKANYNNYNCFTHNPNTEIYSKNSAIFSLYPNKFYSKKLPK